MPFFRKRPVVVEACRVTLDNSKELTRWGNGLITGPFDDDSARYFLINTGHGIAVASLGDYIVKGVAHEFYPVKDDVFIVTYEEVGGEPCSEE